MEPTFRVFIIVNRPRHDVFEAVADPKELSAYFTTGGASARLEQGQAVTWDFADFPGAFPVEVTEVGWHTTDAARQASYGNCMGWAQMLAALKMWAEHRINLREGAYK